MTHFSVLWEGQNDEKEISKLLQDFTAVSTRELSGVDICKNTFDYDKAVHTLDPTLLIGKDFYIKEIISKYDVSNIVQSGLLSYVLDEADEKKEIIEFVQKELNIKIIGRSRKQKVVLTDDFVIEELSVDGKQYQYQQVEASFTQPNAQVNQKMLTWASDCLKGSHHDLVELYCGNGNFTAVLAQHFDKVLATEISKVSVNSANYNFDLNKVDNVTIARLSSEEFTQALQRASF